MQKLIHQKRSLKELEFIKDNISKIDFISKQSIKIELHLAFPIHLDVPPCNDHTYARSSSNMEFERLPTVNQVSENQTYIAVTTEENPYIPTNFQQNI